MKIRPIDLHITRATIYHPPQRNFEEPHHLPSPCILRNIPKKKKKKKKQRSPRSQTCGGSGSSERHQRGFRAHQLQLRSTYQLNRLEETCAPRARRWRLDTVSVRRAWREVKRVLLREGSTWRGSFLGGGITPQKFAFAAVNVNDQKLQHF